MSVHFPIRTRIMGILNVTPDSFSDGGEHSSPEAAVAHAVKMEEDGADIIDIGGESTRPGSEPVDEDEELRRVVPVVEAIKANGVKAKLSIDTRHASVARKCLELGAEIINDVSSFESDPAMADVVREHNAYCVLMHGYYPPVSGTPFSVASVVDYLRERIEFAIEKGIQRDRIIVDPGIGFNKTTEDNLAVLRGLDTFAVLNVPLLMAASRKRFIGAITGVTEPSQRLEGSLAVAVLSVLHGASMLRVHDVAETRKAVAVVESIVNSCSC